MYDGSLKLLPIVAYNVWWDKVSCSFPLPSIYVVYPNFQDGDAISVMKAGKLRFSKPNKYWVESCHKRVCQMLVFKYLSC